MPHRSEDIAAPMSDLVSEKLPRVFAMELRAAYMSEKDIATVSGNIDKKVQC